MTLEEHMFRALAKHFKYTQKEGAGNLRRTLRTLDKSRKGAVDMPTCWILVQQVPSPEGAKLDAAVQQDGRL
eukprot:33259-Eustigmatos_ZCMA.PRE.1